MKFDLTTPRNRRFGNRVNKNLTIRYSTPGMLVNGVTLNVSERGARIVVRHDLPGTFDMTLDVGPTVSVKAEKVWEMPLNNGARVVGVRFDRNQHVREWVQRQV